MNEQADDRARISVFKLLGSLLAAAALVLFCFYTPFDALSPAGHRMLGIFIAAVVLWVSEAIPLHATAALVILLGILLVSDKSPVPAEGFKAPPITLYFGALANPVLLLFLGGFFIAEGAAKYGLDRSLARVLLRPFGCRPSNIVLGLMLVTALLSMFMSNTATTAAMMAVVLPVIARLPAGDPARISLALCIPVAANIGGMGTPVGTPPNAIVLGALSKTGQHIGFTHWMLLVIPMMIVLLLAAWQFLVRLYPSRTDAICVSIENSSIRGPRAVIFYVTAGITLLLWFTEPLHGIQTAIIGFLPVVVLLATRVITEREFHAMPWNVLWLVGGGIALGDGVGATGLDRWLVGLLDWNSMKPAGVLAALSALALLISTFISNSATANLLIPVGISLAVSPTLNLDARLVALFIATGSSLAMSLPISTPPNAIAYATGQVTTRQMALIGILIAITGYILLVFLAPILWRITGLLPN